MDIIDIDKFNALPGPVAARIDFGAEHWIETLCVQTGCMRLDVCGKIQLSHFDHVRKLIDADGNEHNPDIFYID